jgi:hypothetical protein
MLVALKKPTYRNSFRKEMAVAVAACVSILLAIVEKNAMAASWSQFTTASPPAVWDAPRGLGVDYNNITLLPYFIENPGGLNPGQWDGVLLLLGTGTNPNGNGTHKLYYGSWTPNGEGDGFALNAFEQNCSSEDTCAYLNGVAGNGAAANGDFFGWGGGGFYYNLGDPNPNATYSNVGSNLTSLAQLSDGAFLGTITISTTSGGCGSGDGYPQGNCIFEYQYQGGGMDGFSAWSGRDGWGGEQLTMDQVNGTIYLLDNFGGVWQYYYVTPGGPWEMLGLAGVETTGEVGNCAGGFTSFFQIAAKNNNVYGLSTGGHTWTYDPADDCFSENDNNPSGVSFHSIAADNCASPCTGGAKLWASDGSGDIWRLN